MDRYTARINLHGHTQRERTLQYVKRNLSQNLPASLSCKDVKINGVNTQLIINSGTQTYYKEFETIPGQTVQIHRGDYVEWAGTHWLVTSCDSDNELYKDGSLTQCNWLLKWQNEAGEIIERWAVILSASKYNDGTTGNNVIQLGSDQLSVQVPVDSESLKLKKSMGKRFFIDHNSDDPTTYELTGTGNVIDTYDGHGTTFWIVKECAYTPSLEDLKYGICAYFVPDVHSPTIPDESNKILAVIQGNEFLVIGKSRTYTVDFLNPDGSSQSNEKISFRWNLKSEISDKITKTYYDNDISKISLYIGDTTCIGAYLLLQIVQADKVIGEKRILVKSLFG